MKPIVRIQYNSDFTITNSLPDGYYNEDFIVQLYTTDEASYFEAKYIGGVSYNCTLDLDNNQVVIYVNNHGLDAGCLHVAQMYDYNNNHFADGIENLRDVEETNIYLVKQNASATSAMFVGSNLPDLTGSADFITYSDLMAELTDYVTDEDLEQTLENYATESYVAEYVAAYSGNADLSSYVTYTYLESKNYAAASDLGRKQDLLINGVNIKSINGYSLLGNGNIEVTSQGTIDLSSYVTYDYLESQSYVTNNNLADYVTEEDLNLTLGDFPTYTDVENILNNASYVTMGDVSACGYITSDELAQASYITTSDLDERLSESSYVTQNDIPTYTSQLTNDSGFITLNDVPSVDLSSYVTKDELNQASYVTETELNGMSYVTSTDLESMGYITTIPSDYATYDAISQMGYITTIPSDYATYDAISKMGYVTSVELANASYVTEQALSQSGYITMGDVSACGYITSIPSDYATYAAISEMGYITTIPSEYITSDELAQASYITETELNEMSYVTEQDLSQASYATQSYVDVQLSYKQDTLVSGVNIKTINNNSLVGSGNISITASGNMIVELTQAQYDAMEQAGTLDPTVLYIITDAPATDLSYYAELTYVETYYVAKTDLDSMGYITINDVPTVDLSSYVSYDYLESCGYITKVEFDNELQHAAYATQNYVDSYVATYVSTYAPEPDLSSYATKSYTYTYYVQKTSFIYDSSTYTLTINI